MEVLHTDNIGNPHDIYALGSGQFTYQVPISSTNFAIVNYAALSATSKSPKTNDARAWL